MGFLSLFTGKSAADHERDGDEKTRAKAWGEAKLAFEAALVKLEKQSTADPGTQHRLQQKVRHCKEALARSQYDEAMALMEADCVEEALELMALAAELTADPELKAELIRQRQEIQKDTLLNHLALDGLPGGGPSMSEDLEPGVVSDDADTHFNILLGTMPETVQMAYRSYGDNFKEGYLALNQGAFDKAVEYLAQAAQENSSPLSLVPLELATAYVNLGQVSTAKTLLEALLQNQPDLLPAIELLCEIYWEEKAFDRAMQLIDSITPEQAESINAYLLKGETLMRANRHEEARTHFQEILKTYGWNNDIAMGLARSMEALGLNTDARDVYGQLISQCSGCGARVAPSIKRKYAELSFDAGDHTPQVLELYLALSQEDPANAANYYQRVSRIYATMGNQDESLRFQSIAESLAQRQ